MVVSLKRILIRIKICCENQIFILWNVSDFNFNSFFVCESVKCPAFEFQAIDVISLERIKSRSAFCDLLHVSWETFVHFKFILYLSRTNECEKRSEDPKKAKRSKWTWIEQATFPLFPTPPPFAAFEMSEFLRSNSSSTPFHSTLFFLPRE